MSFDLLVFDPNKVPKTADDVSTWFASLTKWDSQTNYDNLGRTTPRFQNFFQELASDFPALNPIEEPKQSVHWLQKFTKGWRARAARNTILDADDFDEACLTEYTIARDAIYLSFAWSVSEKALRITVDTAIKANVGFWHVSAPNSQPIYTIQDLMSFRRQLGKEPAPRLTKANLFKMLKTAGWHVHRDPDDGSRSAVLIEGEKIFRVYPNVRQSPQGTIIEWNECVIPTTYRHATSEIDRATEPKLTTRPEGHFYPITLKRTNRDKTVISSISQAEKNLGGIVEKLRKSDTKSELQEVSKLPLSSPENAPIRILASKACLGEYHELCEIRDRMKNDDRQGLAPYITVEHLENAIAACVEIGH